MSIFPVLLRSSNSIIPKHMFRSLIGVHFSSSDNLPGAIPVQVVSSLKKDTPAGTSWILPGGSSFDISSAKHQDQLDGQGKVITGS